MNNNFKVITLCGSTKFKNIFEEVKVNLTLQGFIVISLGIFSKTDGLIVNDNLKDMLISMHKQKIDMSDGIFVVNKNGYIGKGTMLEIEYAKLKGKSVKYLEPTQYNI